MRSYPFPTIETITRAIGLDPSTTRRCRQWAHHPSTDRAVLASLRKGQGVAIYENFGMIEIWRRGRTYFGLVSRWGTVTILVETTKPKKLCEWLYWERKVIA